MRIAVTNSSTLCTDADVAAWCEAITAQLVEVAQHWGRLPVPVLFAPGGATPAAGYDTIVILDDADQAGALGWHASATGSFPFGRVFARPAIDNHVSVSSVLSHEILELFVDPFVGLWASDMTSRQYALELCDPVEGDSYDIGGVAVSNYALPAWFDAADQTGPWDRMGTTKGPFQLAPGGYAVFLDEGGLHTIFGDRYPEWRKATKESPAARTARRWSHHRDHGSPPWWASELLHAVHGLRESMVMLVSDQSHLDADVQALVAGLDAIEQEIAALKNQPQAASLDFSALDAAVSRLQGDAQPPAPPTPPDQPPVVPPVEPPTT